MDPDTVLALAHDQAIQYPSVEIEHPFGPEYAVYKVRGKMFLMFFDLRGVPSMNLKIDPLDSEVLRDAYEEITPAYHMNKLHWITVAGAGEEDAAGTTLDVDLLHDLVLESYCLVVAKMAKRDRPVDPATFGGRADD
ncbi:MULTISPECIES: MmcQ/YjbR family DNA-binding protein [Brevibacterium]|uniref:Predicted DNA-binding protein, MmcQ/YjbR family n=3 Tax=Brevibacterium TaxID=1696 RepID=A0A2H1KSP6_9MICO|nr:MULTISPECIES: MmcQ/YjbR family DNA-binding protein [Brevibacterium]SMX88030.1 Predicted DNA-binding protein, MmcQ/YjbR family [Brevibacterium antiquum]SMY02272.1 Predicted DNA-binding protein, MmcQ/YjbR family [Brevibacterium antiquum CNRZ 918]HCG54761.1 MmcQ-like protein [Brevibacterium sp.]